MVGVAGMTFTVMEGVPLGELAVQPFASVTDVSVYPVVVLGEMAISAPLV